MLFLRDSLLGGSTVRQKSAQIRRRLCRYINSFFCSSLSGGIMTIYRSTYNMWTCRIIQLSSPHSTHALSPAMFYVCVCLCVFAADKGSGGDQRSRDGLVCCRPCMASFARCRIKSPPPPPLPSLALLLCPDSTNRKEMRRDRDSGLDVTSRLCEPPAESQPAPLCLPNWSETTCVAVFTG